jgi:NAD(P)H-flavin reductase
VISVPVRQITHATPRTRILNLDVRAADFSFVAGQAAMFGLNGSALRKPYSIASAPFEVTKSGIMQVLVQVEDSGGLDPHLELASPGTLVDVDGPFGTFGLPAQVERPLLFIAGGTGIAPLRSMLIEHLARPSTLPVTLIYSARSVDEFAFGAELGALAAAGRIKSYLTVTRDQREDWPGRRGRISEELVRDALPSADSVCLVCGPPPLVNDTRALLAHLGVSVEQILNEKY